MSKYVLGESAARKLREIFASPDGLSRRAADAGGARLTLEDGFAPPFTVQWAASLARGESSEGAGDQTSGEWIIWLPPGDLLIIDGEADDITADLDPAEGDYPEGWFKLGDNLDRDEGGALYLDPSSGGFTDTPGSKTIKICDAAVDADTGARTVKQYVTSAIILGGEDTITTADEKSISRKYAGQAVMLESNIVQIKGFGRFKPDPEHFPTQIRGTYEAATNLEVGGDYSEVAFLVRTGNSDTVDGNTLGFRKIRISGASSNGCYAINSQGKLINQYFIRGGVVETTNFTDGLGEYSGKIVALKIAATPGGSVALAAYDSIGALTAASQDPDYTVTPLYWLESDGKVKVDFRNAPRTQNVEVL